MRHYIASGFFDENQLRMVQELENKLTEQGDEFFSPRTITKDLSPNNPNRMEAIMEIFKIDTEEIDKSNQIDIILDQKMDIGVLFELGYSIGKKIKGEQIEIHIHNEVNGFATQFLSEFSLTESQEVLRSTWRSLRPYFNETRPHLLVSPNITTSINLGNNPWIPNFESAIFSDVRPNNQLYIILQECIKGMPIIVIDDYPAASFVLMGILYKLGIKYYTASAKGYGSNVMIAASSQGHVKLGNPVESMFNAQRID